MRRTLRSFGFALLLLATAACGRKGDPLPPRLLLPGPPRGLSLAAPAGALTLSWSAPEGAVSGRELKALSGYVILRERQQRQGCPTCPPEFERAGTVDLGERQAARQAETLWIDRDVEAGWTYRYRVRALDARGRPGAVSPVAAVTWLPLPPPTAEALAGDGEATVRVAASAWPKEVLPLGFRVYGLDGRKLAEAPVGADAATIEGLANGRPLELSVRLAAQAPEGWDLESPGTRLTVTPRDTRPPIPPSDLAGFPEPSGVRLVWFAPGPEAYAAFLVLRREEGSFEEIARVAADLTSYVDAAVRSGRSYTYTVVGVDEAGNRSLPAKEIRIRVP